MSIMLLCFLFLSLLVVLYRLVCLLQGTRTRRTSTHPAHGTFQGLQGDSEAKAAFRVD